jgi:segregation and condensation protein A
MAQSTQDPPRSNGEQPLGDGLAAPTQQVLELSVAERVAGEALIIDVDGFEGPLDLLLTLGRTQKVDLRHISILALAEQYLEFVERAKALRIELAADYLVMAAWLAFLKSRLLLPPEPGEEGPTGEEMAAHLAFQLERLAAMREAAAKLMARDRLGRDFFARGVPEQVERVREVRYTAGLLDLMQAYARIRTKDEFRPYVMDRENLVTMEEALDALRNRIGLAGDWTDLMSWLPQGWVSHPERRRSATASTFAASLELAKAGKLQLRQDETFAPIKVRRAQPKGDGDV